MTQVCAKEFIQAEREVLDAVLSSVSGEIALVLGESSTQKINNSRCAMKGAVLDKQPAVESSDAFVVADYTALPFAKGSVDVVLLSHVIEQKPEVLSALIQELSVVLREQGTLIITLLNRRRRFAKAYLASSYLTHNRTVPPILSIFRVLDVLAEAGFDQVDIHYYAMRWPPAWLNRFLRRYFPGLSQGFVIKAERDIKKLIPLGDLFEFKSTLSVSPLLETREVHRETR